MVTSWLTLTLYFCMLETPKIGTFSNREDPDEIPQNAAFCLGLHFCKVITVFREDKHQNKEILTCDPLKYIMDNPFLIAFNCMGKSIRIQRVEINFLS